MERDECPHWGAWECRCSGPKCGQAMGQPALEKMYGKGFNYIPKPRYRVLVMSQDKYKSECIIKHPIFTDCLFTAKVTRTKLQRNYFKLIS